MMEMDIINKTTINTIRMDMHKITIKIKINMIKQPDLNLSPLKSAIKGKGSSLLKKRAKKAVRFNDNV